MNAMQSAGPAEWEPAVALLSMDQRIRGPRAPVRYRCDPGLVVVMPLVMMPW